MRSTFLYTLNIKNGTKYDRWHHGESVEMDKNESQYIKKPEKKI